MDITPLIPAGRQIIKGYGDKGFTVSGIRWEGSVLVFPDRTLAWGATDAGTLSEGSFAEVIAASPRPELLLLGCGARMVLPPPALRAALKAAGIKLEVMDTGGACRTFNVLLAEDRSVAAALIAV
ncbi:conserved hypothetical protein [Candidatus Terasakiella magnetica]|nr:conserved hypothetical protein [Candidatus Terasakiella magnetica]